MLNENLVKIRKERGLTQAALAVKLNVVRQTISKWEQGTAVPDADMLCRIAEALEVSVTDLLGIPTEEESSDSAEIVKVLAEINEQLALKNRRSHRIWKTVGLVLLAGALLNIGTALAGGIVFRNGKTIKKVEEVSVVQISEQGVPLLQMDDSDIEECLGGIVSREQLLEDWGEPDESEENTDCWKLDTQWNIRVRYDQRGMVTSCGKEN